MIFRKDKKALQSTDARVKDLENRVEMLITQNRDLQTQFTAMLKVIVNTLQQLEAVSQTTIDSMHAVIETRETLNKLIVAHYNLATYVTNSASAAAKPLRFPPFDKPLKTGAN